MYKAGDLTYIAGEWLLVSEVIEHPQYGICYKFTPATDAEIRKDAFLFGEAMGRIVVGVDPKNVDEFVDLMTSLKVPFFALGHVTKGEIRIDDESFGFVDKVSATN